MVRAAEVVAEPFAVSTNHQVRVSVFSDSARTKATSFTGQTITALIKNPNGSTWKSYTCSAISASLGTATFTLTGASHTTTGDADVQVHIDGILKRQFTITFVEKAS